MSIAEPMTVATDYLLAIAATVWGVRLARHARASGQRNALWWACAFAAVAVSALVGGTYHGLAPQLAPAAARALWKLTLLAAGGIGFAMVGAAVTATVHPPLRRPMLAAAALALAAYAAWSATHDDFLWVIVHSGGSMLVALALFAVAWVRRRAPAAPWIAGAILVSFAAAAVQASGLAPHRHFNHNDLYHVIQLAGLYLFYRGALLARDAERFPGSAPGEAAKA